MVGPRSETMSDLQLELLAEAKPGVSREEVAAEAACDLSVSTISREGCLVRLGPFPTAAATYGDGVARFERLPHCGREICRDNLEACCTSVPCLWLN